jgi:hypothetical protein
VACIAYGGEERRVQGLVGKRDVGSMDWIELAQDRDRWLALVNAVMNLQVP